MLSDSSLAAVLAETGAATSEQSPARVVLADDHALMRHSVRGLLDGEGDVEVVAEAGDLASAARLLERHLPCVLVLDLRLSGGSSMEMIGSLRERVPQARIVVMTMEGNRAFARRALAAGALGFITKELADEELPDAIRAAARGRRYNSPRATPRLRLVGYDAARSDSPC